MEETDIYIMPRELAMAGPRYLIAEANAFRSISQKLTIAWVNNDRMLNASGAATFQCIITLTTMSKSERRVSYPPLNPLDHGR